MRGVLQLAADKAGWDKPLPAGQYRGVACFGCFASYMAEVVEITMENDQPRVHRVVAVVDCGQVVNPSILEQQIQGGIVYGLANALRAKITIEKGRVVQGNFDDYAPLRMEETPVVEVYAVPSTEAPSGIGEPSVPPLAPALCNAIYSATKKRIRALPILQLTISVERRVKRKWVGLLLFVSLSSAFTQIPAQLSSVPAARLAHIRHGINLSEWFAQVYDPGDTPRNISRPGPPPPTSR